MTFKSVRRRRRRRPRLQLQVQGFTAAQLGAKVGVSARTVHYYTAQRVLPTAHFRGSRTRYVHEHLIRLAAIRYLLRDHRRSLKQVRVQLAQASAAELERMAAQVLPELAEPNLAPTPSPTSTWVTSKWQRVTVIPGVEVHVQNGASDAAVDIANEIAKDAQRRWAAQLGSTSSDKPPAIGEPQATAR